MIEITNASSGPRDPIFSKTDKSKNPPKISQAEKQNILNNYRSYTYNFTLAALRKDLVNDPERYRNSELDLVILKSGGKGTQGLSTSITPSERITGEEIEEVREGGRVLSRTKRNIVEQFTPDNRIVKGFNENSPGRFDLFIENVEIETIMAFTKQGGSTLPTSIKFRVIEPYSINGFIEALHVSAVAAGYTNYAQASYILKVEFVGYPDDAVEFPSSKIVEKSSRYFPFKFTGVEVEINERGTNYRCAAVPWNDSAFGQADILKRPINMSGFKVHEILENLAKNINEQIKDDDRKTKKDITLKDFNEYEIKFPTVDENGFNYSNINEIGKTSLESLLRSNRIFKFPAPETGGGRGAYGLPKAVAEPGVDVVSDSDVVKLHPGVGTPPQIQFAENQRIHEIISAVVRDSEYVKKILKENKIDDNGFIDYFAIKSDVVNKAEIDPVSRKPYQKITYSVIPYKVHFTKIPTFAGQHFDPDKLQKISLREYNYIYTGQNVDVLNFKLNFNTLFFEAIPVAMANNNRPGGSDAAGKANSSNVQLRGDNLQEQSKDQTPPGSIEQIAMSTVPDGINASQRQDDPYYNLARNMHSAIIDSKASMITGEIEIIGDPLYLVTGGIGNYNPRPAMIVGQTTDGEADYLRGDVLININFRNPIDINPLEKGGNFYFENEKLPFSGVYKVLKAVNTFNDGVFKQRLEIIRIPGQIIKNIKETEPNDKLFTEPNPRDQQAVSTSLGEVREGVRADDATNLLSLGRGLPSSGLPGVLSNFVGVAGGLGGQAQSLLTQVSGAVSRGINNLTGANSVFGSNIPGGIDQLASGIRLRASGLLSTAQTNLADAASVVAAAKNIPSEMSLSKTAETIASDIKQKASAVSNLVSVKGSGIGEGASILLDRVAPSLVARQSENTVAASDLFRTTAELPQIVSTLGTQISALSNNALSSTIAMGASAAKLISGVGDKISSLTAGTPTDPKGIAAKFGFNSNQLSGLSANLQSKVISQVESLAKQIPEDTDLNVAASRGLILEYIPATKLSNLPATEVESTAPLPAVDRQFLSEIVKTGGPQALANAFGVSNIKNISNNILPSETLNSLSSEFNSTISNPLLKLGKNLNLPDVTSLSDKIQNASKLIEKVNPSLSSVESNVISLAQKTGNNLENVSKSVSINFGSKFSGKSPLDKLFG